MQTLRWNPKQKQFHEVFLFEMTRHGHGFWCRSSREDHHLPRIPKVPEGCLVPAGSGGDTSHAQDMADQMQRAGYCVYHIVSSLPNIPSGKLT